MPPGAGTAPRAPAELGDAIERMPSAERVALTLRIEELTGRAAGGTAGLAAALAADGFEIGFHTRGHERLRSS